MQSHSEKKTENQNQSIHSSEKDNSTTSLQFKDHRPEAIQTKNLQGIMNTSPQVMQQKAVQEMMNNRPLVLQQKVIQDKINQPISNTPAQLQQAQPVSANNQASQGNGSKTGLPGDLKEGIENLSGISMDDVKVHYNSVKPAQLNAHAYAQGTDIHVASGQEKHLPHEAWHVIQQKQGRVQPTLQMKNKVNINDNEALEQEADEMGSKATQLHLNEELPVQKKENKSGEGVVQRNETSTKVLSEMAAPKVGQQDIELAIAIQTDLDHIYDHVMKVDEMNTIDKINYNSAVCLGGIILPPMKGFKELGELIKSCEFVNLGKGSVNRGIFELLGGDLKGRIVANTLLTMSQAGQLDYLKESDFGSEAESGWKVVVEVHYYRERPTSNNVFHKDTLGTTLFVNLNYLNKEKMVGPEYVLNPADNGTHMEQLAQNLPEEFLQDRAQVMEHLEQPRIIEVVEVPKYGYVAFVDETINHSSPTTEHRKVKGSQIHKYLRDKDTDKYDTYKAAYVKYSKRWTNLWDYESYLPEGGGFDGPDWLAVFEHIKDGENKYDRNEIREIEPERRVLSDDDIDKVIHIGGHDGFGKVSIPGAGPRSNMTSNDRPLKRRMSMNLDQNSGMSMKKESGGKRSFFRTWVRAEKISTDVLRPDWKWDQKK